jgi:hypothetical protein
MIENRESRYLTFDSGVKPIWIQKICEKFDITHYCLDIEYNMIFKNISKANNYKPLCYMTHDNHMYLITDNQFVQRISYMRPLDLDAKFVIKMLQQENQDEEDKRISVPIFHNVSIDKIYDYKNCYIIYQANDLLPQLQELYTLTGKLYPHSSRNKKIVKITYEKEKDIKIILAVDPNFALKHFVDKDTKETLTSTHVQELCKTRNIVFKNQPVTSIIHQIGFNNTKHE